MIQEACALGVLALPRAAPWYLPCAVVEYLSAWRLFCINMLETVNPPVCSNLGL
jgi:hypothetical protein